MNTMLRAGRDGARRLAVMSAVLIVCGSTWGADTTPPTLSGITVTAVGDTWATVNWQTSEPADAIVEVPCLVDGSGIQPTNIGKLPAQLAALIQTNINVQLLTVEAALTRKRQTIYQAAMLDPHTAAELDPSQVCSLVDELVAAHGSLLPEYS